MSSSNVINPVAYLRTSRNFPTEASELAMELNKSYIDTANVVNARIIGIFPVNRPAITGEMWFIDKNQKQQSLRQVFFFTTKAPINHGIKPANVARFTRNFGEFTDGTNWYGLIHASNVAIVGQVTFYVTPTQIIFLTGAGAPALTSGTIVLEWLSAV